VDRGGEGARPRWWAAVLRWATIDGGGSVGASVRRGVSGRGGGGAVRGSARRTRGEGEEVWGGEGVPGSAVGCG
jgi:hypothetical protein